MDDLNDKAWDYFLRHLVGLRIRWKIGDESKSKILSTFLFYHRGRAFLITAGHVFHEVINQALNLPPEAGVSFSLYDHVTTTSPFNHEIPFERSLLETSPYSSRPDLYDFAMIPLTANYSELLTANKLCHLSEEYLFSGSEEIEAYFLCGFPEEINDTERKGKPGRVGYCVKHVNKILSPPSNTVTPYPPNIFFAKIVIDEALSDISGMSGGPIFGLLRNANGVQEYGVCAIQAGWIGNSVTVGCSVKDMLYHLNKYCDDLEK